MSKSDAGSYTCFARNRFGMSSTTGRLLVTGELSNYCWGGLCGALDLVSRIYDSAQINIRKRHCVEVKTGNLALRGVKTFGVIILKCT